MSKFNDLDWRYPEGLWIIRHSLYLRVLAVMPLTGPALGQIIKLAYDDYEIIKINTDTQTIIVQ